MNITNVTQPFYNEVAAILGFSITLGAPISVSYTIGIFGILFIPDYLMTRENKRRRIYKESQCIAKMCSSKRKTKEQETEDQEQENMDQILNNLVIVLSVIGSGIGIVIGLFVSIIYVGPIIMKENSPYKSDVDIGRLLMIITGMCIVGVCAFVSSVIFPCISIIILIISTALIGCQIRFIDTVCFCRCWNNKRLKMCKTNIKYIFCNIPKTKMETNTSNDVTLV